MSKFKYFIVDMFYKHVFGEMNEFEFNAYDEDNHNSKQLRFSSFDFNFNIN